MAEQNALVLFQSVIQDAGLRFKKVEALVKAGWTLPMVREATDIAVVNGVRLGYIARMERQGIPVAAIGELIEFKQDYPDLSMPLLWQCWQMCVEQRLITDHDREFFNAFLEAAESLFHEASITMRTGMTKSPSFVFRKLLRYATKDAHQDLGAVMHEIFDDPEGMLQRIMSFGNKSSDHAPEGAVRRGNPHEGDPYEDEVDLADLADE